MDVLRQQAVHVTSPPRCTAGLHGLSSLRMICKARSCAKRVCMINTDHVAITYVSGCFHLARIFHDAIGCSMRRAASAERCKGASMA